MRFTISFQIWEKKKEMNAPEGCGSSRVLGDSREKKKSCESSLGRRTIPFRISSNSVNVTLRARILLEKGMDLFPRSDGGIARGRPHEDAKGTDFEILFINNL